MATTLPTLTDTLDNLFLTTWYEIRKIAIDNILKSTPIWAVLEAAGSFTPQVGGKLITRTLGYGETSAVEVERGDLLPAGEDELETMAIWKWRTLASHVQRSFYDDQQNRGPSAIKSFVGMKLQAAIDGLEQKYESSMLGSFQASEATKVFQSLNDMIPPTGNRTSGAYGGINRPSAYADSGNSVYIGDTSGTNAWWGPKYLAGTYATLNDDLIDDMRKLYNSLRNNQVAPNLIITTQELFEAYELYALDISQIIKERSTKLADLGFETLMFKGKPMVWSDNLTAKMMLMINTDFIEIVFDPGRWFEMTAWKPIPLQEHRIAHILCFANMISTQLRRHGRLTYS